jgi:hypothetical protein
VDFIGDNTHQTLS